MAVSLQPRLPGQMCSTVEKAREISKTTLYHLRRILSDHDYLKHSAPDQEDSEEMSRVLTEDEPHVGQKNVKSGPKDNCSSSASHDSKVEKAEELPNDGIQASDLSSLLHKFEEAIGNSVNILTPATSPGHFENWSEPLSLKINSHVNATDFTPPTTPPVQEQPEQKHVHNNCKPSTIQSEETSNLPLEKHGMNVEGHNAVKKGKSETVVLKKLKRKGSEIGSKVHKEDVKLSEKEKKGCKRKCKDTVAGMISCGKKAKTNVTNKSETDTKSSENCLESKSLLPKTSSKDKESTKKIVDEECVENSRNEDSELLSSENVSDVGDMIEEKSKTLNEEEKIVVPSNNVLKEPLNGKNCLSVRLDSNEILSEMCSNKEDTIELQIKRVKESLDEINSSSDNDVNDEETFQKQNSNGEMHNNNNNKTDLCRMVGNNLRNGESTPNKDDRKRKSKDFEKTSKGTDDYKDNRRKRRHRSKSTSSDEDSTGEERLNPRKSEKHSRDSERGKEKYRKYSSRDNYDQKYSSRDDYDRKYSSRDDYDRKYPSRDDYDRDYSSRRSQGRKYSNEERRHRNDDENREKKPKKYIRDIEQERKIDFRLGRSSIRDVAKEKRRVIYVGGLPYGTTRDELWKRFRKFGPIEKVTVHLRVGVRDNYGFVTFLEPEDARDCIERGNSDPNEPHYDLCFGGRRQFCGGSYVDFDSTTSHIEELSETYGKVCDEVPEEDDFDSLLRMCQEGLGR